MPTLEVGDRFLANKFVYRFWEPERGDVIVFRSVEGGDEDLVKRIVAVAGDEVAVENGVLRVNGVTQNEPYTNKGFPDDGSFFGPTRVPEGEVFVMGTTGPTRATRASSVRCPWRISRARRSRLLAPVAHRGTLG